MGVETPIENVEKKIPIWYGVTNLAWLSIKGQLFFMWCGFAAYAPFIVLYYDWLGLKVSQIGGIEVVQIVLSTIARPIFGAIADKSGRHSTTLGVCVIIFLVPTVGMIFIPPTNTPNASAAEPISLTQSANLELRTCTERSLNALSNATSLHGYYGPTKAAPSDAPFYLICEDSEVANQTTDLEFTIISRTNEKNCSVFGLKLAQPAPFSFHALKCSLEFANSAQKSSQENSQYGLTFWLTAFLRWTSALAIGPCISMADAITYDMLGPKFSGFWGQQRMFGTLAWGICAGVMGAVLDQFKSYTICFVTSSIFCAIAAIISFTWLPQRLTNVGKAAAEPQLPFRIAIKSLFVSPIFCCHCIIAIASGTLIGVLQVVWPQMLNDLGAPKILFGADHIILCTFEIPMLFFSGAVIDRIGEFTCVLLCFIAYTIRYTATAFLTPETVWFALPIETLHMFCFSLYFSAASRSVAAIAPKGTSSTVQAIIGTSFLGIGNAIGIFSSSVIYQSLKAAAFFTFAAFAFGCFIILLILYFAYLRKAIAKMAAKTAAEAKQSVPNDPLMGADISNDL